jgi:hypothetical protein
MTAADMVSPQETVERALAAARSEGCVVIAEQNSNANLRWAANTLTTNGLSRSRQLTVIAIDRRADGVAVGVVSRAGVRAENIEDVVREPRPRPPRTRRNSPDRSRPGHRAPHPTTRAR